jgi:hypothetical protein
MGVTGVTGTSLGLFDSRFFSSVRRKTLIVVRRALCGLQSSADKGECSQTGHEAGRVAWQPSQMACSQQGKRNALTASLLQMAHRSFAGISSCGSELGLHVSDARRALSDDRVFEAYLISSACASVRVNDAAISRRSLGQAVAHPVNVKIRLCNRCHRAAAQS